MHSIPPNMMREIHSVLASCHEFETTQQLRTLFLDTRLQPFWPRLPAADMLQQRVDNVIYNLHNHYLVDQSNALVNLLVVLAGSYPEEYLGIRLSALADRLRITLSPVTPKEVEEYLSAATIDQSTETSHTGGFEQILGISNLKEIMWLQMGITASQSVCRLLLNHEGRGSGFLIGNNLLLTNNHVIPTPQSAAQSIAEFNYQYDNTGSMKPSTRYHLDASRFKTNIALDYTLVGILQDPNKENLHAWGSVQVNVQAEPIQGEHVIIIQHPDGGPKQIAITGNYVKSVSSPYIRYTTDTRPGSSGAPVYNDGWQVVALHHRCVEDASIPYSNNRKINQGILIDRIREDAGTLWPDPSWR